MNSYDWANVTKKMKRVYDVTGARPGFILAVPSDHCLFSNGWEKERKGFMWRGGKLIKFDAMSTDFHDAAESIKG